MFVGPLTFTFTTGTTATAGQQLFNVINNRTLPLVKATYAFGPTNIVLALESCPGTWTSVTTCSTGTPTVLLTTSTTVATSVSSTAAPTAPTALVQLRLRQTTTQLKSTTNTYTLNVNVGVTRAEIRSAATTNS
jgi:hypothetical protein